MYRREFVTNLSQMYLPRLMRLPLTRLCFRRISCELEEVGSQKCLLHLGCICLCREVGFCSTVIAMLICEKPAFPWGDLSLTALSLSLAREKSSLLLCCEVYFLLQLHLGGRQGGYIHLDFSRGCRFCHNCVQS